MIQKDSVPTYTTEDMFLDAELHDPKPTLFTKEDAQSFKDIELDLEKDYIKKLLIKNTEEDTRGYLCTFTLKYHCETYPEVQVLLKTKQDVVKFFIEKYDREVYGNEDIYSYKYIIKPITKSEITEKIQNLLELL